MREIKLRAFDKRHGNMLPISNIWDIALNLKDLGVIDLDDVILLEYTGEHDKHSKALYEGDIVKDDKGNIGEVKFVDAQFAVECKDIWLGLDYPEELEIIGNIYEHSES